MPVWATWFIVVALPVASFVSGLLGQWWIRKKATEELALGRTHETLTNVRWAAELALSAEPARAALGIEYLGAISTGALSGDTQKIVDAALAAVVDPEARAYDASEEPPSVVVEEG